MGRWRPRAKRRLRWVRHDERVFNPSDPDLSTISAVVTALGYELDFDVVHAHTGIAADCECNIVRGEE